MARTARPASPALSDSDALRLRAAWLYWNRGLTQSVIAEMLGVSRSTVIRMLDEARKRSEVQIWIDTAPGERTDLALELEERLGLERAIVVPGDGSADEVAADVGAALGRHLSETVSDGMRIGVTWGRTLSASLATFRPPLRHDIRVVSLVGGVIEAQGYNPVDFSWQFASRLGAECMLYLAPLFVDATETRDALIERCGLDRLHAMAGELDLAILSCGDFGPDATAMIHRHLTPALRAELLAAGAICESAGNFLDAQGRDIVHPIRTRTMTVDLDTIGRAKTRILACGGASRATAIHATLKRARAQMLVTNEGAAKALLARA